MKRATIAFDVECDAPLLPGIGLWSIDEVRRHIHFNGQHKREQPIQIICGAIYDLDRDRVQHYLLRETDQRQGFLSALRQAKRLISHSGKVCDLTIIEETYGMEQLGRVRALPHVDLFEGSGMQSLDAQAKAVLSPEHVAALKAQFDARWEEANARWPETRMNWRPSEHHEFGKISKCIWDVKKTGAVFLARQTQSARV